MSQQYHQPKLSQSPLGTVPPYHDPSQAPTPNHDQQQQHYVSPTQQPGETPVQYPTQPHGEVPMQQQLYYVQGTVQPGQMQQMQQIQQSGMVGVMGQQQQSRYLQATPIPSLGRSAAPVDCPACGKREMTNVSFEVGNSTHAWALGACCFLGLGCIPYLMNSLKDIQHKCGSCGVLLATWHRSGTTETHMNS